MSVIEASNDGDYKMEMLGPRIMQGASIEYWMGEICRNIGVDEIEWRGAHTLEEQGKVIAQYQLSNEMEMVNRHEAKMYERRKKSGVGGKNLANQTPNILQQAITPNPQ